MKVLFISILLSASLINPLLVSHASANDSCQNESSCTETSLASSTLQAIQEELATIADFFSSIENKSNEEKIELTLKRDIRRSFFRLQTLSKMYSSQAPDFLPKMKIYFKSIEDIIGQLSLATTLRQTAEKLEEPELIAYFITKEIEAQDNYLMALEDGHLLKHPEQTLAKISKAFATKVEWKKGDKEKQQAISLLVKTAKKLQRDVEKQKFDDPDIELGLHELRRQLRWLIIQVDALSGLVQFDMTSEIPQEVQDLYQELSTKNPGILESKYLSIRPAKTADPVLIPLYEMAIITEIIEKVGAIKDLAEIQIYFDEALEETSSSPEHTSLVREKIRNLLNTKKVDHQALSRRIQERLAQTNLLMSYIQNLEALNQ